MANGAALVLPGDAILAYERSLEGTIPSDRFEFSRRDASVGALELQALSATRQWPEPLRPAERRIWFSYWQQ